MDLEAASEIWRAYKAKEISQVLHPDDVMYNTGPEHYFTVGLSAIQIILRGLSLSWIAKVKTILDLPCGHGRVARHLRAAFPEAQISFCDIDASGAEFCAGTFGGRSIKSQPDLTQVALPIVDLIWVGSLFTHVDRARTDAWLHYLARHLTPHGVLVATFHGLFFQELTKTRPVATNVDWPAIDRQFRETGYGYARYIPPDMGDYGLSLSKASAILDIATAIPETRVLAYTERGWANNHDVLVLTGNDRLAPMG